MAKSNSVLGHERDPATSQPSVIEPRRQTAVRIRKTPYGLHLYTASIKNIGTYGWGNTPAEARARLLLQLAA